MTPGFDISSYQRIDDPDRFFADAYAAGQRFVLIKASEGNGLRSSTYKQRWAAALRNGLHAGPYHFAGPERLLGDAKHEARLLYEVAGPWNPGDLPPVLDLESAPPNMNPAELQRWLEEWLGSIEGICGRRPLIYSYPGFIHGRMRSAPLLAQWGLWLAHYNGKPMVKAPVPWMTWRFWQWTGDGRVPWYADGKQPIDLDWFNGTEAELRDFCGGGV